MKKLVFLSLVFLTAGAVGYTDSLRCRLVDWMDARSNHELVHERTGTYPEEY